VDRLHWEVEAAMPVDIYRLAHQVQEVLHRVARRPWEAMEEAVAVAVVVAVVQ